ncbi:MAG TPA: bifunctional UDP-sugar hydrolase/5'-nucleotidase [Myxococcota bacterium]|nr:bifunctional UDP-sugar hydrolase/5'-nucleotidase [Myxococcota bacterium]
MLTPTSSVCGRLLGAVCLVAILTLSTLASVVPIAAASKPASDLAAARRCVAVVGTNDLHGAVESYTFAAGDASVQMGGVVSVGGYVANLRDRFGARVLLLDGGDLFQGTLASNLSLGKAVIDAYNLIGYDAAAVGNHEFDFGPLPDRRDDRLSVLKQRISEAKFPFLALNIFDRATGKRVEWPNTKPSIIKDVGGIKVGILGISTPETPKVTKPQNVTGLIFKEPAPLVLAEARALRQAGAELVVLVGHLGGKCRDLRNPEDVDSCEQRNHDAELLDLLQALPAGAVDVAVGGHTHQFMAHWINGTATIESGARGQYLGWVEACVAARGGGIDKARSTIHAATELCLETWADGTCKKRTGPGTPVQRATFLGAPVGPDLRVRSAMAPYLAAVSGLNSKPVGVVLPRHLSTGPLTDLVAEAMRRESHADFGLQNRGGVRTDLPAGPLTFGQIFGVLPFDNTVSTIKLTGAQVVALVKLLGGRHGGYGAPSFAGLSVSRSGESVQVLTAKGKPIIPTKTYVLSTSDFLLQGGDGADAIFGKVPEDAREISDVQMRDALIHLLGSLYPG